MNVKFGDERLVQSFDLDDDDKNIPSSKELKAKEFSNGFKMPPLEKYNRRSDPTNHINMYKTRLQDYIPIVKCRNFHTTIVFDVKRWYKNLKPESIRSWHS
ncbi:activating signal cointegrator 1 complex subunit 2-like protein [Abeliophyllum distichum]|uniref:Activating signal cointegrator 1 complex subunit 2-like protein n=1 Tax=Abeliophyllum distichum TaxID=126358 RepID=A0ABD1SBY4_9LAMI